MIFFIMAAIAIPFGLAFQGRVDKQGKPLGFLRAWSNAFLIQLGLFVLLVMIGVMRF